jgi:hypothetical protein
MEKNIDQFHLVLLGSNGEIRLQIFAQLLITPHQSGFTKGDL